MAATWYQVLGVQKTDSEVAICSAYRKLAKRHHPDVKTPASRKAAERFKEISAAYDILSDKDKRARYDRGEIDASGNEVPPQRPFYRDFGDAAGREKYRADAGFDPENLESIFAQAFGGRAGTGGGRRFSMRGQDARYQRRRFPRCGQRHHPPRHPPDGRTLYVRIPPGVHDGQVIRLKGQGTPGIGDGAPGDALVEVTVAPHPVFHREGDDIIVELPVTLQEAVLGTTLEVPTIKGPSVWTTAPNSGRGTRLRLRGRGIGGEGHQFVELVPVLPPADEPELAEFLKSWKPRHPTDPRAGMETG